MRRLILVMALSLAACAKKSNGDLGILVTNKSATTKPFIMRATACGYVIDLGSPSALIDGNEVPNGTVTMPNGCVLDIENYLSAYPGAA